MTRLDDHPVEVEAQADYREWATEFWAGADQLADRIESHLRKEQP